MIAAATQPPPVELRIPCRHWHPCANPYGGCCDHGEAVASYGPRPTYGTCLKRCCHYVGPPRGRGDRIHRMLRAFLIDAAVRRFRGDRGTPCGCNRRRRDGNRRRPAAWAAKAMETLP